MVILKGSTRQLDVPFSEDATSTSTARKITIYRNYFLLSNDWFYNKCYKYFRK